MTTMTPGSVFEELLAHIPRHTSLWKIADVLSWLNIIGLEQYSDAFNELKVDGYLILDLTDQDLEEELKISSKLHRKKLLKAISTLREYNEFLQAREQDSNKSLVRMPSSNDQGVVRPQSTRKQTGLLVEEELEVQAISDPDPPGRMKKPSSVDIAANASEPFIDVISIEGPNISDYHVGVQGVKIGRHSSNQIAIYDESVSRYHSEILYENRTFYIKDIGSTTGTFIKVVDPLPLKHNMIVEIGSYQFLVQSIFIDTSSTKPEESQSHVKFIMYESPEEFYESTLMLAHGSSIGRKASTTYSFESDLHMSNLHCKISLIGNRFYLEDMESTNGTWLRLSLEGQQSELYPLSKNTIFKIGNTAMYEVQVPKRNEATISNANEKKNCLICKEPDKDCLLQPCKHNVVCEKCAKNLRECPFCQVKITDRIKIFRS